jgi:ComF family protein
LLHDSEFTVLDRLFVESCPSCGGATERGFCAVCAADLARIHEPCRRCGLASPVARCPSRAAPWLIDAVVAPFTYLAPLDHYVRALKYGGARALGRAFGLLLAEAVARYELDALIPVPLHRTRLRERGYNQAVEIARTLARELRLPLLQRGISRRRASRSQIGQSAEQRRASVSGAFRVRGGFEGARLAIVDDVLTTGATANALAAALRAAGAASCIAVAAARTPEQ